MPEKEYIFFKLPYIYLYIKIGLNYVQSNFYYIYIF